LGYFHGDSSMIGKQGMNSSIKMVVGSLSIYYDLSEFFNCNSI